MSSQLITDNAIVKDEWVTVIPPEAAKEVRKQAGKVVMFKLTGEDSPSEDQINATVLPENGKILLPLKVYLKNKDALKDRLANNEIGIWVDTHEEIESFKSEINDINQFPLIAVRVGKFADGRIFSIGTQLRIKFQYKNDLRAFGDVLRDQLFFLKRTGFNSYLIREDRDPHDALLALNDFSNPYQAAADNSNPAWKRFDRNQQGSD